MKSEHAVQASFFLWCKLHRDVLPPLDDFYAIPNGGKRSKKEGKKFKVEGVKAGIPDTHLPFPTRLFPGLYIEFKNKGGRLSNAQKRRLTRLRKNGYCTRVCDTLEGAIVETLIYLSTEYSITYERRNFYITRVVPCH